MTTIVNVEVRIGEGVKMLMIETGTWTIVEPMAIHDETGEILVTRIPRGREVVIPGRERVNHCGWTTRRMAAKFRSKALRRTTSKLGSAMSKRKNVSPRVTLL